MLGWFSDASSFASRSNRASRSTSFANSSGRTLMATSRSSLRSRARHTSPIPPLPSREVTSYDPRVFPISRRIEVARHLMEAPRGMQRIYPRFWTTTFEFLPCPPNHGDAFFLLDDELDGSIQFFRRNFVFRVCKGPDKYVIYAAIRP